MSNTTITPNMGLIVPTTGQEPGPNYANDVNNSLTIIDGHNHTIGYGVQVPTAGININADLPMNGYNLTLARTVRFNIQSGTPSTPSDLGCLYVQGVDLYYIDEHGNNVRITQNGAVSGSPGSIANLVSPASASYNTSNATFVFQSGVNTPANIDGASYILRNLAANSFGLTLAPPASMGSNTTITLPTLPAANAALVMDTSGNITASTSLYLAFVPTGAVLPYAGPTPPSGWLLCDGSSQLRSTYANLFAVIGTAYGSADSTHFNLPQGQGMFLRGVDNGAGNDPDTNSRTAQATGGNTGDLIGSSQAGQIQTHQHYQSVQVAITGSLPSFAEQALANNPNTGSAVTNTLTQNTGGNQTNPINIYVNFIIKT